MPIAPAVRLLRTAACGAVFAVVLATVARSADRHEFTTMIAHWSEYGDPEYIPFVAEARPDVAQFGFYGGHFWSLAHTPQYKGYPAHFPVQGIDECSGWFAEKNRELHGLGVKVVGHMNVKFLVGEPDGPEGPRGFFKFYRDLWNEEKLGPKPVADPMDFLERKIDGTYIVNNSYSIGKMPEYWACLNNPNWRKVLKAWVKFGIAQGVDGYIANYFYRHDCHCEHCVRGFKQYMGEKYTAAELKEKYDIADLNRHVFQEIVAWHNPAESTPLRRDMLQWSQIANKRAFDEVFIDYGRSLKPDLIAAQWNHLSNFSQISGDERCLLPADLWGKGEDYLWYSMGASGHYSDLENRYLGEGTLQARYIRGAFDDKPFTLGKYENTRTRVAIAELAANGGAPMGFYARFTSPDARQVFAQYYQFLRRHDGLFRANRPHAEVLLLYPRSAVHQGNLEPVLAFRELGTKLLDEHVLFDIRPDDLPLSDELAANYDAILNPSDANAFGKLPSNRSRCEAPYTVRVSASRPADGKGLTLHFVNYNRIEPEQKKSAGGGTKDEKPIAVEGVDVEFRLPDGLTPKRAEFLTPEAEAGAAVKFTVSEGRLKLRTPGFLVYGVVHLAE